MIYKMEDMIIPRSRYNIIGGYFLMSCIEIIKNDYDK